MRESLESLGFVYIEIVLTLSTEIVSTLLFYIPVNYYEAN